MKVQILLADTCVVSDFYKADLSFFSRLTGQKVEIGIISPIIEELGKAFPDLADLSGTLGAGLRVFDPAPDEYLSVRDDTSLSRYDQLCMLAAKRLGYTLATNDKCLRRACAKIGIPVLWSLETLLSLCREGAIDKKYAETIARYIHKANSGHIKQEIFDDFLHKLADLS